MPECPRCAELERALEDVRRERDELMLELARERERHVPDALPRDYPNTPLSQVEGAPLRYVLVDRANDAVKTVLGPMHTRARKLLERLRR